MSQTALSDEPSAPVRTVHRLEDLDDIFRDDVDGVIWGRRAPSSVMSSLSALPAGDLAAGRFIVPVSEVGNTIVEHLQEWGSAVGPAQQWLAEDVEALAGKVAQILPTSLLRLRVELVRNDACRKFHRDTVKARLICTYSGPGTEIAVVQDDGEPAHIGDVPTGCPILLKGKLWPGYPQRSVLHRSPPIEGTGVSRLVVVLDQEA